MRYQCAAMRIALGIEYDGRRYAGWQVQPHGNTVQNQLVTALSKIAGVPLSVIAAGRTDAGVHALGQVVHFDCSVARPDRAWVRGVNAHLPADIAVRWMQRVDDDFHARFSALSRSYRYLLLNRPVRPALVSGRMGWFHPPLDVAAMREAAQYLVGRHDFSSFRAAECQAKSPIKTLQQLEISTRGELIQFSLRADAFLHHMVRNLVGALLYVGKHAYAPQQMACLVDARDRRTAPPTFMPDGLYLSQVEYPAHYALPCVDNEFLGCVLS